MSASLQAHSEQKFELREKMYFSWAGKLWYVMNVSKDDEMAFVEDCKTLKVRWIKTDLFIDECEEVKC